MRLTPHNSKYLKLFAVISLALLITHCGSDDSEDDPASTTFSSVWNIMKNPTINCGSCHAAAGGNGTAAGAAIDLTTEALAYKSLVTDNLSVTAGNQVGTCGSAKLVVPNSPATSYLLAALFTSYNDVTNPAGVSGCSPTEEHITHFASVTSTLSESTWVAWINGGAKR